MPFAILPALQWAGGAIWSFASSALGQFVIVFAVAWFWSAHHTNFQWEVKVAAENAAREAAYRQEIIRQEEASKKIVTEATARAEENASIAYKLQRQIDEFNAQEIKSEQQVPQSSPKSVLTVLLMATFLTSCASSTHQLERARLPDAPIDFGKPVPLPVATKGKSIRTFALENRAAAITANKRLEADGAFYDDVLRQFGQIIQ